MKEETLDRPVRRTGFGEVNGFVVRHCEMNKQMETPVQIQ